MVDIHLKDKLKMNAMKKFLYLISLVVLTNSFFAQDLRKSLKGSRFTYVFVLSEKQAQKIYEDGINDVDDNFFTTLIDSFPSNCSAGRPLTTGHYLYVKALRNELQLEVNSVNNLNIKLLNNDRDLSILVHDSAGNNFHDAKVVLNHTRIKFDSKTKTFRLPKTNRQGLLKVTYDNHTNYFNINRDINYSKFRRTTNQILYQSPLKYVAFPAKFACLIPVDFVRSIARKRFFGVFWYIKKPFSDIYYTVADGRPTGFIYGIHCWFSKYDCGDTKGYIVFNKPKYKPGDTVHVKAYVLDKKNRPLKDSLCLYLQADNEKKLAYLKPYRPGAYKYQFALDDKLGLKLDRNYLLFLNYGYRSLMSGNFKYEDYELKSTNYVFRSDKTDYKNGDQIALYCKGTDENELNLPDARVELTLISKTLKKYYKDRIYIPDTLWRHKQNLDPLGETKLIIPDSIFPSVSMDFSIEANFLNSNNELQTKHLYLSRDYDPNQILMELKNDSICIDYKYFGKPSTTKAFLDAGDVYEDKPVTLPYREKVNPFASGYYVDADSIHQLFELTQENSGIQCISNRTVDSVWFSVRNPRGVPLSFSIFKKNKLIFRGSEANSSFKCKSTTSNNYFASVQYIWGGSVKSDNYVIPLDKNRLNVRIFSPEVVYPGQKTQISIAVTDVSGNPVKDVDLTTFANTKKFNTLSAPNLPYLGKTYPNRIKYNAFTNIEKFSQLEGRQPLNWIRWNPLMKLDSIELYKFLYPKNGFYQSSFARSNKNFAEISPFLVDSGKLLPVNIAYIDGNPVYFSLVNTNQPYVFRTTDGWHTVSLRTLNKEVCVKKLYLKKGFKTIISINPKFITNPEFVVTKMPLKYSWNEYMLANTSLIAIRNNFQSDFAFIQQGEKIELLNNPSNWSSTLIAGPFTKDNFTFENMGKFSNTLASEPNFEYDFNPQLVKMRSYWSLIPEKHQMDCKLPRESFNDSVYTYNDVKQYWQYLVNQRQATQPQYRNITFTQPGNGQLRVEYENKSRKPELEAKNYLLFSYRTMDFIRVYSGSEQLFQNLEPGYYKLIVLLLTNNYFKIDSIVIKPNGLNFCRLNYSEIFTEDNYIRQVNEIIQSRLLQFKGVMIYDEQKAKHDLDKINKLTNNTSTITYNNTSTISGMVVDAKSNEPLIGVNILVKGTEIGTISDADGCFKLSIPNTTHIIQVSYLGYQTEEIQVRQGANIQVKLVEDIKKLEEVVVIGYGTSYSRNITCSVASVHSEVMGKVAGVDITATSGSSLLIRGMASLSSGSPLYIIDGLPMDNIATINPNEIETMEVLKSAVASNIYGSKGVNGAVIITTRKKENNNLVKTLLQNKAFMEGVRQSNSLRNRFSDYAFWKPDLVTNEKGVASFEVIFPDDVTSWKTYALAMGKKMSGQTECEIKSFKPVVSSLAIPRFLIAADQCNIIGKGLNYTPDSIDVDTNFEIEGKQVYSRKGKILTSRIDTVTINAPQQDSLSIKYSLTKDDGYSDGELRHIPIFPAGTLETKGTFNTLEKDTTISYHFDKNIDKVTIHADASLVNVMLDEIKQIRNYSYLCNEQLSSKLKAMLWEQKIFTFMKKKYPYQKEINKMIKLLEERRNDDSLWGWWKTCETQWWITMHVSEALMQAKEQGFKISINLDFVAPRLHQIYGKLYYRDKIRAVKLLTLINPVPNYKTLIDSIKVDRLDTVGRYELLELKQTAGIKFNINKLLDERKSTLFGNYYWGSEGCSLFDDAISATLVVYRILRHDSSFQDLLPKIRNYFLERRRNSTWRNTWESCRILETILPDLILKNQLGTTPKITLSGAMDSVKTTFPFTYEINSGTPLTVTKQGANPVYFTVYQQFFNKHPEPVNKDFSVNTHFEQMDSVLRAGKPVILYADIKVKKSAEYVMIEIPIPAGCSYNDKNDRGTYESHREYLKEKVSIFCSRLPQGDHTFKVSLLPRYNGAYHLNPAKAELMYFPVFFGRERMKMITIQ